MTVCRRRNRRFTFPAATAPFVEFGWPERGSPVVRARVTDVSASGLAFAVPELIPGLDFARQIRGATVHLGQRSIRADLLAVHVTRAGRGAVCGCLFYPATDADLTRWRRLLTALEAQAAASPAEPVGSR